MDEKQLLAAISELLEAKLTQQREEFREIVREEIRSEIAANNSALIDQFNEKLRSNNAAIGEVLTSALEANDARGKENVYRLVPVMKEG